MTETETIPLFDARIEQRLLGAGLVHSVVTDAMLDRLSAEDFYRPAHQTIFGAIREIRSRGIDVDPFIVSDQLHSTGKAESVGGDDYLNHLADQAVGINAYPGWIDVIREKSGLRRLWQALDDAKGKIAGGVTAASVSSELTAVCSNLGGSMAGITKMSDIAEGTMDTGYSTGLYIIDNETATQGAPKGQTVIVTASEGVGKSTLMLQIATHAAWKKRGVLYVTLADLNAQRLKPRILRMVCGYSRRDVAIAQNHELEFIRAEDELNNWVSFAIDDRTKRSSRDVDDILGSIEAYRVKQLGSECPLTEVFIDYAQKLTSHHFGPRDSYAGSVYASAQISSYAESSGLTVYVGSQITDGNEKSGTRDITKGGRHWQEDSGLTIKVAKKQELAHELTLLKSRFGGQGLKRQMVFDEFRLRFKEPGHGQ